MCPRDLRKDELGTGAVRGRERRGVSRDDIMLR